MTGKCQSDEYTKSRPVISLHGAINGFWNIFQLLTLERTHRDLRDCIPPGDWSRLEELVAVGTVNEKTTILEVLAATLRAPPSLDDDEPIFPKTLLNASRVSPGRLFHPG
jgi:hypothetical protein